jgi:hypothetical protein
VKLKSLNPYPHTNHNRKYHFITESGTEYIAHFERVPIDSCIVYHFVFAQSKVGVKKLDLRIRDTIANIIYDFWIDYDDVILFVCDSSDGRAQNRMRLFDYWYRTLNFDENVVKINFSVNDINAAILAKKDNCLLPMAKKEIQELFDLMSEE